MMDDDLFKKAMADVTPLKHNHKIRRPHNSLSSNMVEKRRESAQLSVADDENTLSSGSVEMLDANNELSFKRAGIQQNVYKKLKQGRYPQEDYLDLHGLTVEQARKAVYQFIEHACQYHLRSVVVVHGRGLNSQTGQATLKSYVNRWLPELESVLAFCSAKPKHGGVGSVYVLLKNNNAE